MDMQNASNVIHSGGSSEYELEAFRDRVQQLYMVEKRPLKDVMETLEQEGCHASKNMYLKKLRIWGFKKNYSHKKRAHQTFEIIPRNEHEISIGSDVKMRKYRSFWNGTLHLVVMKQPENLELANHFFARGSDIQRMIVSNHIATESKTFDNSSLYEFFSNLSNGIQLMAVSQTPDQTKAAGALLERGFRLIDKAFNPLQPDLIYRILFLVLFMMSERLDDLVRIFLRHVYQVCSREYGSDHTLTILFGILHQQCDCFALMFRGIKVMYESTIAVAGQFDKISLGAESFLIMSLLTVNTPAHKICHHYETLIARCDQLPGSPLGIQLRRNYGTYLAAENQTEKGLSILREGGSIILQGLPQANKKIIEASIYCCYELGYLLMEQPVTEGFQESQEAHQARYDEAENILKLAVDRSMVLLGPKHTQTLMASEQLADFYKEHGNPDKGIPHVEFLMEQLSEFKLG